MGMSQKKRGEKSAPDSAASSMPPPPASAVASMIYSVATQNDVGCPRCNGRFEISTEYYGMVAECPECNLEFVIKAPGTPPFRGPIPPAKEGAQAHPNAPSTPNNDDNQPNSEVSSPETTSGTASQPKKNNALIIGIGITVVILLIILIVLIATK
jgi:hypothetical protein